MAECNQENNRELVIEYPQSVSQPCQIEPDLQHDASNQPDVNTADYSQIIDKESDSAPVSSTHVNVDDNIDMEQTQCTRRNSNTEIESAPLTTTYIYADDNINKEQTQYTKENTNIGSDSVQTTITYLKVEENIAFEQSQCGQQNTSIGADSRCSNDDLCEPCTHRNLEATATNYCLECDERYCDTCTFNHQAQKQTKKHSIVDIADTRNNSHQIRISSMQYLCDICISRGEDIEAVCYCLDCEEPDIFCEPCSQNHTAMKNTRSHKLSFDLATVPASKHQVEADSQSTVDSCAVSSNTSDEMSDVDKIQPVCEPCSFQGFEEKATTYCMECDEKYCSHCSKRHTTHKRTRDHNLIDITNLSVPKREVCEPCEYNEEHNDATCICTDCQEYLCDQCAKYHRSQKQNRSHNVIPLSEPMLCESCLDMEEKVAATSFCVDCEDPYLLCQSCAKHHLSSKRYRDHHIANDLVEYKLRNLRKTEEQENFEEYKGKPEEETKKKSDDNQPGKPYVTEDASSNTLTIKWQDTALTEHDAYQVMFKEDKNGKWKLYKHHTSLSMLKMEGLLPQTSYVFKVRVINDMSGTEGPFSLQSDSLLTGESPALGMMRKSNLIYQDPIAVYALPLTEIKSARNEYAKTRKLYLGKGKRGGKHVKEKNVMVVGATGSGKSTLINAMANYLMGVTWEDQFRFTLIDIETSEKVHDGDQAHSQTEWVTCYIINNTVSPRLKYTVNLIDTPSFGDTRGLYQTKQIVEQIKQLFTDKGKKGVTTIDAVCFILKAPDARLSAAQIYIFEEILSLFGNDIKNNICTLITFADGQRPPVLAALEALEHKSLPHKQFFIFNNSALYVCNTMGESSNLSPFFWEMGMKSCEAFFNHLNTLPTKSLLLTSEVLVQRDRLENTIQHLHNEIDMGLCKINVLEQEIDIFTKYKRKIRENIDFTYTVTEQVQERKDISGTCQYTTNCLQCNFTCHANCMFANDKDKARCCAMGKNGNCTECPAKCHWTQHHNTPFIIIWSPRHKEKKYSEKLKIYQEATQKSLTQKQVLDEMSKDIQRLEYAISDRMDNTAKYNHRIKEMALRPDPLTTTPYMDLMIASEKREKKVGFESRIDAFEKIKKKAQYGKSVKVFQDRARLASDRMDNTAKYNNRIKEIALRPDPLTTTQYMDLMIASEKREKKSGFESRIDAFEKIKKKAQYGKSVKVFQDRERLASDRMDNTAKYNNRIKEIALLPDPLTTTQYMDLMIASEKREKKSGFESRIDAMEKIKKKAQYGKSVKLFQDRARLATEKYMKSVSNSPESAP